MRTMLVVLALSFVSSHALAAGPSPDAARQADALETVGDAAAASGELGAARAAYEESLALRRSLATTGDTAALRDLSTTLYRAGALALMDGEVETAAARFAGSLGLERGLYEAQPDSLEAQLELSASLRGMGEVLLASAKADGSYAAFVEALTVDQRMAHEHPGVAELEQNLAEGQRRAAWAARVMQQTPTARETAALSSTPES